MPCSTESRMADTRSPRAGRRLLDDDAKAGKGTGHALLLRDVETASSRPDTHSREAIQK